MTPSAASPISWRRSHATPTVRRRISAFSCPSRTAAFVPSPFRLSPTASPSSTLARAVGNIVGPTFSAASYAYRPKRGPRRAAEHLAGLLTPGCWAVVTDIEGFFDNVDHDILLDLLRQAGLGAEVVRLFQAWVKAPVVDRGYKLQPLKGIPQGSPASPMLANLYLTAFDHALARRGLVPRSFRRRLRRGRGFGGGSSRDYAVRRAAGCGANAGCGSSLRRRRSWKRIRACASSASIFDRAVAQFRSRVSRPSASASPKSWQDPRATRWRASCALTTTSCAAGATTTGECRRHRPAAPSARHVAQRPIGHLRARTRSRPESRARGVESLSAHQAETHSPFDYAGGAGAPPPRLDIAQVDLDPLHVSRPIFAPADAAFANPTDLRVEVTARATPPTLLSDGTLMVPSHGAFLTRRGGLISLRRKKVTLFTCADGEVRHVVLVGPGTLISTSVRSLWRKTARP